MLFIARTNKNNSGIQGKEDRDMDNMICARNIKWWKKNKKSKDVIVNEFTSATHALLRLFILSSDTLRIVDGIISRSVTAGETAEVSWAITANHGGGYGTS